MSRHGRDLCIGAVMTLGGLAMFFLLHDVETPVVGLRQAGLVIAVLGLVELAATGWSIGRSRRPQDR
ncbi:DUF5708 family protein [Nocardioides sp. zg-DK7169]|uniref:DUF5708 family protein n=1 Tax=Nocardioides sp. zg-DK7169 TaxID=2736600 RepID=UPI001557A9A4|nr:DUF5708 family protein [Nocardioides sp. zg-DK7169]NPC98973.1 hypothetical protein [Nocardioides sp. zg-DK7169]